MLIALILIGLLGLGGILYFSKKMLAYQDDLYSETAQHIDTKNSYELSLRQQKEHYEGIRVSNARRIDTLTEENRQLRTKLINANQSMEWHKEQAQINSNKRHRQE